MEPYRLTKLYRRGRNYSKRLPERDFGSFLYNKDRNTYCGRTPWHWLCTLLFLLALYCCVAAIWIICYNILFTIVPFKFQKQPILSYLPTKNGANGAFVFTDKVDSKTEKILMRMDKITGKSGDRFGPCSSSDDYGYAVNSPCVFLKVNRIMDWKLDPYKSASDLPSFAPNDLVEHINNLTAEDRKDRLWVSCSYTMKSNMTLEVKYYPSSRSMPRKALELEASKSNSAKVDNADDYERIVAVQFEEVPRNELINVECYIWAKNIPIKQNVAKQRGKASLKILINKDIQN